MKIKKFKTVYTNPHSSGTQLIHEESVMNVVKELQNEFNYVEILSTSTTYEYVKSDVFNTTYGISLTTSIVAGDKE